MDSKMVFRDIRRTENLEEYLMAHTEELVSGLISESDLPEIQVTVFEDRHRNGDGRRVHFVCQILLHLKGRPAMKISKSSFDFYQCVADAGVALRKQIRRDHRYQLSKRRRANPWREREMPVAS